MNLNESPSLKHYKDGLPEEKIDTSKKKKIVRSVIVGLAGASVLLWIGVFIANGSVNAILGRGAVTGRVVNEEGKPLNGEAFILGLEKETVIDSGGVFLLEDIPAGYQNLVISHHGAAEEYPVTVQVGEIVNVGEIRFLVVTQVPEE